MDGEPSFETLFLLRWDRMVRRAYLIVGSRVVAEDVVQEAFTEVYQRWGSITDPAAYLARVVTTGAIRHGRRQGRERPLVAADERSAVDDHPLAFEDLLSTLSPQARAIVTLKFYDGLSEREIARQVGCRSGTVGPTITRALRHLATLEEAP